MTSIGPSPLPPAATGASSASPPLPAAADFSLALARPSGQNGGQDAQRDPARTGQLVGKFIGAVGGASTSGSPGARPQSLGKDAGQGPAQGPDRIIPGATPSTLAPHQAQSTVPAKQVVGVLHEPSISSTPTAHFLRGNPPAPDVETATTGISPSVPANGLATAPWSRVFSQHWLANGYLSMVVQPDLPHAGDHSPAGPVGVAETGLPASASRPTGRPQPPLSCDADGELLSLEPLPNAVSASHDPSEMEMADRLSRSLCPVIAADRAWSERLVRVSRREDGAATLWLRDFALSPEQVGRTVEGLVHQARQEGLLLDRIMVNGHPVWQAPRQQGSI